MKLTSITIAAAVGLLGAATCFAQTPSPPSSTTNPNSASSPSQRESTHSPAAETPAQTSKPSDASTPHQRQAMANKPQTMKECMDAQAAKSSAMSQGDMTKACNDQMKMQKEHASKSKPSTTTDDPPVSSPK